MARRRMTPRGERPSRAAMSARLNPMTSASRMISRESESSRASASTSGVQRAFTDDSIGAVSPGLVQDLPFFREQQTGQKPTRPETATRHARIKTQTRTGIFTRKMPAQAMQVPSATRSTRCQPGRFWENLMRLFLRVKRRRPTGWPQGGMGGWFFSWETMRLHFRLTDKGCVSRGLVERGGTGGRAGCRRAHAGWARRFY